MKGFQLRRLALLPLIGALSACTADCDFTKNDLELAATLPHSGGGYDPLPHDVWTTNPDLEAFLDTSLKADGIGGLSAKYGLQCVPAGCADCFACRKTIKEWRLRSMTFWKCIDYGEVLVQAEIDPGHSRKVMTYWRTTPDARAMLQKARLEGRP